MGRNGWGERGVFFLGCGFLVYRSDIPPTGVRWDCGSGRQRAVAVAPHAARHSHTPHAPLWRAGQEGFRSENHKSCAGRGSEICLPQFIGAKQRNARHQDIQICQLWQTSVSSGPGYRYKLRPRTHFAHTIGAPKGRPSPALPEAPLACTGPNTHRVCEPLARKKGDMVQPLADPSAKTFYHG